MEYIGIIIVTVIFFVLIGVAYTFRYFRCMKESRRSSESIRLLEK